MTAFPLPFPTRRPTPIRAGLAFPALLLVALIAGYILIAPRTAPPQPLVQIDQTPLFDELQPITRDNVTQLTEVARLGAGTINNVAWSPDGETIAAAGVRGVFVYPSDLQSEPRLLPRTSPSSIRDNDSAVAFSPDSTLLATSDGANARLWEVESGAPRGLLETPGTAVTAVAFSPDGTMLAAAYINTVLPSIQIGVIVWTIADGDVIHEDEDFYQPITALLFSDDDTLMTGDYVHVRVIPLAGGDTRFISRPTDIQTIGGVAISPDGSRIAWSYSQGFGLWDTASGEQISQTDLPDEPETYISFMDFSADGSRLAIGALRNGITVWNVSDQPPDETMRWGESYDVVFGVAFDPTSDKVAVVTNQATVTVWDSERGAVVAERTDASSPIYQMTVAPDSRTIAVASVDGTIITYDLRDGSDRRFGVERTWVNDLAFQPGTGDGAPRLAYAAFSDSDPVDIAIPVGLIDPSTGEIVREFAYEAPDAFHRLSAVNGIAFAPDGSTFYAAGFSLNRVLRWNVTDANPAQMMETLANGQIAVSPDGRLLAVEIGSAINVVEAATNTSLWTYRKPNSNEATYFAFVPLADANDEPTPEADAGRYALATLNQRDAIRLLDPDTGEEITPDLLRTTEGEYAYQFTVSPDGRLIAYTSSLGLRVRDLATGESLLPADLAQNQYHTIAFSEDDTLIIVGGWDGFVRAFGVLE